MCFGGSEPSHLLDVYNMHLKFVSDKYINMKLPICLNRYQACHHCKADKEWRCDTLYVIFGNFDLQAYYSTAFDRVETNWQCHINIFQAIVGRDKVTPKKVTCLDQLSVSGNPGLS